jgi:hypothetical protein
MEPMSPVVTGRLGIARAATIPYLPGAWAPHPCTKGYRRTLGNAADRDAANYRRDD